MFGFIIDVKGFLYHRFQIIFIDVNCFFFFYVKTKSIKKEKIFTERLRPQRRLKPSNNPDLGAIRPDTMIDR